MHKEESKARHQDHSIVQQQTVKDSADQIMFNTFNHKILYGLQVAIPMFCEQDICLRFQVIGRVVADLNYLRFPNNGQYDQTAYQFQEYRHPHNLHSQKNVFFRIFRAARFARRNKFSEISRRLRRSCKFFSLGPAITPYALKSHEIANLTLLNCKKKKSQISPSEIAVGGV